MLSVPEASARILAGIAPLPAERVALLDAVGRVLATDAVAPYTLPHWDNSSPAVSAAAASGAGVPAAARSSSRSMAASLRTCRRNSSTRAAGWF